MNTIISISVSEEDGSLVLQTNIKNQVELIGILEITKMQIFSAPFKVNDDDVKFPTPETEA
jgi:hypothetical protein